MIPGYLESNKVEFDNEISIDMEKMRLSVKIYDSRQEPQEPSFYINDTHLIASGCLLKALDDNGMRIWPEYMKDIFSQNWDCRQSLFYHDMDKDIILYEAEECLEGDDNTKTETVDAFNCTYDYYFRRFVEKIISIRTDKSYHVFACRSKEEGKKDGSKDVIYYGEFLLDKVESIIQRHIIWKRKDVCLQIGSPTVEEQETIDSVIADERASLPKKEKEKDFDLPMHRPRI